MRVVLVILIAAATGCALYEPKSQPAMSPSPVPAPSLAVASDPAPDSDLATTSLRLLAAELNSARLAARKVETLPTVHDPLARREILLNVALYRAAYQTRISRQLDYIVLEPVVERNPPDLGIDPEEFRLRVLGALDNLPTPVAWTTETWRSTGIDYFPATNERATRLRITILQRDEDQGTVLAEISDWTADLGASRQKVTCAWDGLAWNLERDPVRMAW